MASGPLLRREADGVSDVDQEVCWFLGREGAVDREKVRRAGDTTTVALAIMHREARLQFLRTVQQPRKRFDTNTIPLESDLGLTHGSMRLRKRIWYDMAAVDCVIRMSGIRAQ